jgi:hypothetical protein
MAKKDPPHPAASSKNHKDRINHQVLECQDGRECALTGRKRQIWFCGGVDYLFITMGFRIDKAIVRCSQVPGITQRERWVGTHLSKKLINPTGVFSRRISKVIS